MDVKPKNKLPEYLYISVGSTGAMFTLKHCKGHFFHKHVKNLSTNPDTALQKAMEYSKKKNIPLHTDQLSAQLRKIKRCSAEQIQQQKKMRDEERKRRKQERLEGHRRKIDNGIMPIGKHAGKKLSELPRDYIEWITDTEHDQDSPMYYAAEKVLELIIDDPLPIPHPESIVGKPKERHTFRVTCINSKSFVRPCYGFSMASEKVFITTMVDEFKNCIVCFSPSFKMDVGEKATIKATIKDHSLYDNQAQTIVQRVKKIE